MWDYLLAFGAAVRHLDSFRNVPCPPDIIGINYYVTSDRFLDERVEAYPQELHGGNWPQVYADDAAVRASA